MAGCGFVRRRFPQRFQAPFELCDLLFERSVGKGSLGDQQKMFALKRFLQIVECAIAHCEHSLLHRSVGGQKLDRQIAMGLTHARKRLLARHPRHLQIQERKVRRAGQRFCKAFYRIDKFRHRHARHTKDTANVFSQRWFVIDDEDAAHSDPLPANQRYGWPRMNLAGGSSTLKMAPPSSRGE
jgi:hypothetical protein